jgi:hypothetical protein
MQHSLVECVGLKHSRAQEQWGETACSSEMSVYHVFLQDYTSSSPKTPQSEQLTL